MSQLDLESTLANARARLDGDGARAVPPYARLTRKEARVREDQYAALSALARELMRQRPRRVERITENTLIRVAIDMLLGHRERLCGATEVELRQSVVVEGAECRSGGVPESEKAALSSSETSGVTEFGRTGVGDFGMSEGEARR